MILSIYAAQSFSQDEFEFDFEEEISEAPASDISTLDACEKQANILEIEDDKREAYISNCQEDPDLFLENED